MAITLSITESDILTVLGNFLTTILPEGITIVEGQQNRVAEPSGSDFVEMTPMFQERLAMNIDNFSAVEFVGSIAGVTLSAQTATSTDIQVGSLIFGAGVAAGTTVIAIGPSIPGDIGDFEIGQSAIGVDLLRTYTVNQTQTVAPEVMYSSVARVEQFTQVTMQLDVHGPASGDNAQIISTLFRDQYCADFFAQSGFDMAPLYVSDPHQMPFVNGEQQVEFRFSIDVVLEANVILSVPQQFATQLGPVHLNEIS